MKRILLIVDPQNDFTASIDGGDALNSYLVS